MKEILTKTLNMRFVERTKHNEIWMNSTHVLIWNPVTSVAKIKPI